MAQARNTDRRARSTVCDPQVAGPSAQACGRVRIPKTAGVTSSPPLLSHPHAGTPARPHARANGNYAAAATPPAATRTVAIFTLARPSPRMSWLVGFLWGRV